MIEEFLELSGSLAALMSGKISLLLSDRWDTTPPN